MENRIVALYVPESDIASGYFVLSDVLSKLPKDVAIVDARTSYSSSNLIMRLYSREFPEVDRSVVPPIAHFKYSANTGMEIAWPSKEYEDLMLRLHNSTIEESINKDAEVMENEGAPSRLAMEQLQKEFAKMITGMPAYVPTTASSSSGAMTTGCQHEWFAYGRTAAMKHCKKCGAVSENKLDNS